MMSRSQLFVRTRQNVDPSLIDTLFFPLVGRRDRNDPRAMQDDWAHGVDISGLDEKTVRQLIHQVNLEFGDPPTPEPEISWRDYERVPHRKRYLYRHLILLSRCF
jgi:hypothetical protein